MTCPCNRPTAGAPCAPVSRFPRRGGQQPAGETGRGVGPFLRQREGQRRDRTGQFRGSILVQEKAVLSPPHTPVRNADRVSTLRRGSTILCHLFPDIRCCRFLGSVIKSVINRPKLRWLPQFLSFSSAIKPILTDALEVFIDDRRKSEIPDEDRS